MLTLYHFPLDPASRFIRLILAEYNLEFEVVVEHPWESRKEFLLLNPAGTLPVLVDDTSAVCGARTIADYIDETYGIKRGTGRLMPSLPSERAEIRRLIEWFLIKFDADVTHVFMNERVLKRYIIGSSSPDATALRQGASNLRYHILYINHLLQQQDTISGDRLSYADFAAAACISTLDYFGDMPWDYKKDTKLVSKNEGESLLKQWYVRMKSRPSFRGILADRISNIMPVSNYADLDF